MSIAEKPSEIVVTKTTVVHDTSDFCNLLDTAKFEHLQRVANLFASCDLVPDHFRGKLPNCVIAVQMALRLGVDPLAFMQNSYIVSGKCGIETKLATSLLNASGLIRGVITYQISGSVQDKSLKCTATCVDKSTGETVEHTLDWSDVCANEWHTKPAWKKDPRLMIQYRAAMRLIRLHYPGVILGLYAKDELEEMEVVEGRVVNDVATRTLSDVEAKLLSKPVGVVDHVGPSDGTITWSQEIAGCATVADVERVREAWGRLLHHDENEYDDMNLAANKRIASFEAGN